MFSRSYLLGLLLVCSSTAISQQQGNPAMPCYRALAEDSRFAVIRDKVALGGSIEEIRRMTKSAERPSREEMPALAAWKSARAECHKAERPYLATRDTEMASVAREYFASVQALIGELQAGALSYGEFGRRRVELYERFTRRLDEIRRSILPPKLTPHPGGK